MKYIWCHGAKDASDFLSTLVQVLGWCCLATWHNLGRYWPRPVGALWSNEFIFWNEVNSASRLSLWLGAIIKTNDINQVASHYSKPMTLFTDAIWIHKGSFCVWAQAMRRFHRNIIPNYTDNSVSFKKSIYIPDRSASVKNVLIYTANQNFFKDFVRLNK